MLSGSGPERELIRRRGAGVSVARFRSQAAAVAARPATWPAAVNLCERRENFLVAFAALLMRGQACLLPPSRVTAVVDEVLAEYPGGPYRRRIRRRGPWRDERQQAAWPGHRAQSHRRRGYTSGSTGRREAIKDLGALVASTALGRRAA
jgi:hypothetical protein